MLKLGVTLYLLIETVLSFIQSREPSQRTSPLLHTKRSHWYTQHREYLAIILNWHINLFGIQLVNIGCMLLRTELYVKRSEAGMNDSVSFLMSIAFAAVITFPYWRISTRLGRTGFLAFLHLIPLLGTLIYWYLMSRSEQVVKSEKVTTNADWNTVHATIFYCGLCRKSLL